MLNIKIQRDAGGGETPGDWLPLEIDSRDIANFEAQVKGGSFATLSKDIKISHVYHAAWLAARRTGAIPTDTTVAGFIAAYKLDLSGNGDDEEDESDPTQAGA